MMRLLQLLTFVLACTLTAQAKTYIVCVGLADYPGKSNDLKWSANDAKTIQVVYEANGDANITLLTNEFATLSSIRSALKDQFSKATENDAVLFFFSGHGIPGGFVCYDGIMRYQVVDKAMGDSKASYKMVFADACFAGKARRMQKHSQQQSSTSIMYFLSSRTNETSIEKRSWKNSLFTAYLERGLRGGADKDKNRVITAKELFDFVSKGVADASNYRQHPVMWGRFNNDMPVMTWEKSMY